MLLMEVLKLTYSYIYIVEIDYVHLMGIEDFIPVQMFVFERRWVIIWVIDLFIPPNKISCFSI